MRRGRYQTTGLIVPLAIAPTMNINTQLIASNLWLEQPRSTLAEELFWAVLYAGFWWTLCRLVQASRPSDVHQEVWDVSCVILIQGIPALLLLWRFLL
jgi:hypothetical protein